MKFHGVSIHHDNGALGAEENYKATYRKLKLLKDMGLTLFEQPTIQLVLSYLMLQQV